MKAKLVNEAIGFKQIRDPKKALNLTDDVIEIKKFAKKNGWEYGMNKNNTPFISIEASYPMMLAYDQYAWPVIVKKINYTFTYTDQDNPISLRKIWYGYESPEGGSGSNKFLISKWAEKEELQKNQANFAKFAEKQNLPIKNLKQSLMGRFSNIENALNRIQQSVAKELKK